MAKRWRCFHCDEVFTKAEDARLHFGSDEYETADAPGCVDPLRTDEKSRLKELRDARDHALKMQREADAQDDRLSFLEGEYASIPRYFGKDVTTMWLAGDRYKSAMNLIEDLTKQLEVIRR